MILVRQVFQIKFGQMDQILEKLRGIAAEAEPEGSRTGVTRVLTDISGPNFTLVFEWKAESLDAYWESLQSAFEDPVLGAQMAAIAPHMESGYREFYTIEMEVEN